MASVICFNGLLSDISTYSSSTLPEQLSIPAEIELARGKVPERRKSVEVKEDPRNSGNLLGHPNLEDKDREPEEGVVESHRG